MIIIGWMLFGAEALISIFLTIVFWYFWSHSAMPRKIARRATVIYALGCLLCLLLMFVLPI